MPIELVTGSASLIVSVEEAKSYLRIDEDDNDNDTLIELFIKTATTKAEEFTNRSFFSKTYREYFDSFCKLRLTRAKTTAVNSVKYLDQNGDEQTLSTSVYITDLVSTPATVSLKLGQTWPVLYIEGKNRVSIEYVAGYGDTVSSMPAELRLWIMKAVSFLYENRQAAKVPDDLLFELWDLLAVTQ